MQVLLVTKPFAPPWHDSSSGLARALVSGLQDLAAEIDLRVLVGPKPSGFSDITEEIIYANSGAFAPGIRQNVPVLWRLLKRRGEGLRHFFFAPNKRTAQAARLARCVAPVPALHTLCSLPAVGRPITPGLFAQHHVVLSPWAQERLAAEGAQATLIEPAVVPLQSTPEGRARCRRKLGDYVLFAGDLRPGGGAIETLHSLAHLPNEQRIVFACRPKTDADQAHLAVLKATADQLGLSDRVSFLGRIDWIGDLVCAARAQVLPATDLHGKMDYPLVLLEGLAAGVPCVVSGQAPLAHYAQANGAVCATSEDPGAIAQALTSLDETARTRARALYDSAFLPKVMAARYLSLYQEILR
jgi:glycosyltransferase involved in cell wall biosynthesis